MKLTHKPKILTAALTMTAGMMLSQHTLAETTICLKDNAERKISIVYDTPGQAVPCEVTYEKGEGIQTLWRAENEAGYCELKATDFILQQREWGWDCVRLGL